MILYNFETILKDYGLLISLIGNLLLLTSIVIFWLKSKKERQKLSKITSFYDDAVRIINSARYGDLSKKIVNNNFPEAEVLTESLNRLLETFHDRESMVHEYQSELSKQNKILETTINSLSDGLIITDSDGKILRATDNVLKWFCVDKNSLKGKRLTDYIILNNKRPLAIWDNNDAVLCNDKDSNFTVSSVALRVEKKPHYIVILKNVTDQRELENLKEDFVATLTHDLKVPIIAEANMVELFLNESFGKISEKQKLALQNMQTSNKELLELVQTVLETYKIGKLSLFKENIMLKAFLNEIILEMSPISQKTKNNIELVLERDIRVYADKFQLTRVIKNLIQNAILYGTPKTPITITIGEVPKYITIKIKDRGEGISPKEVEKIFNKYYSATKKFKKIGTGLGLYLAFQIIKAHGGELSVESTIGEYTEFCIKIPA